MWDGGMVLAWILNWVMIIAFWVGIIILIIWGVTKLAKTGKSGSGSAALDIAKERYARGELTKEQFEQIKKDIE
ncbi:MAG: SHOCT domain-containing protein [Dehalococcoidales bacterium]|nr:SHOCT domain-containing protein [Dehalococcoidales bacterium]NLT27940.1 SHOCT domain-containing protein [Dehalococcoidales bacterium]